MTYGSYPTGGSGGDVDGPNSAVDNGIAQFDGTTGKLLKDLGVGSANQVLKTDGTAPSFGLIVNANVDASAAIDYSKLASLTSGNILVGSAGNVATSVAMTGDVTISNTGVTAISAGVIVDADINASAAIAFSKMEALTASRALETDVSGFIVASAVTSTELGYVSGVTSGIQGQIDGKLSLTGGTLTGALTITPTSNQLVLGTTNTTTISATAPSSSITLTIPDAGTNADFILSESAQTINGAKTFSSTITGDISGNAGTVTDGAYLSASQSFTGANTFTQTITGDISGNAGTVTNGAYVNVTNSFTSTQNILATTNQLVLGTTNTTTVSATAPSASRVYTMPDVGGNADFVMTAGAQTIGGAKTFSDDLTVGSTALFVDVSTGNVGIGTPSPLAKIDVSIASNFSTTYNTFSGDGLHIQCAGTGGSGNYAGGISFSRISSDNDSRAAGIVAKQTSADADQIGLAFLTHPSATTADPLVEAMVIDHLGNVGIGTPSPDGKLEINGGAQTQGVESALTPSLIISGTNDASSVYGAIRWDFTGDGITPTNYGWMINGLTSGGSRRLFLQYDDVAALELNQSGAVTLGPSGGGVNHVVNGSLGIGITPISPLDVNGNVLVRSSGTQIRFATFSGGGTTGASIDNDGDLIRTPSDSRLKANITEYDKGLAEILSLRPVHYEWLADTENRQDVGFIAQEVELIEPRVVGTVSQLGLEDCKIMDQEKLVPMLVKAIQELHAELQALKGA